MHINGIHILGGLTYFFAALLILSFYLLFFILLIMGALWLFRRFRLQFSRESWVNKNREAWLDIRNVFTWKRLGIVFLFFAVINCFAYVGQRIEWMGDDNDNFKAKEYFVSGQIVYFYRSIASDFIHPSKHRVTFLLDWLQKAIYDEGVKYLPENDGEKGVWLYTWFVYPHSKRFKIP